MHRRGADSGKHARSFSFACEKVIEALKCNKANEVSYAWPRGAAG